MKIRAQRKISHFFDWGDFDWGDFAYYMLCIGISALILTGLFIFDPQAKYTYYEGTFENLEASGQVVTINLVNFTFVTKYNYQKIDLSFIPGEYYKFTICNGYLKSYEHIR
jgi:hypothetical protein